MRIWRIKEIHGLYMQIFKILSNIAFTCWIIIGVLTSFLDIVYIADGIKSYKRNVTEFGNEYVDVLAEIPLDDIFVSFVPLIFIVAPLITIVAFSIIEKWKLNDEIQNIAAKRGNLFVAAITSTLTWLYAIVLSIVIMVAITIFITGKYCCFDIKELLSLTISILVSSTLTTMASAIACAVSNGIFTSMAGSLLMIFLPRFVLNIIFASEGKASLNFIAGILPSVLKKENSILFTMFISDNEETMPLFAGLPSAFTDITVVLWGLFLCIIFFAIAFVLYCKCKNDGKSFIENTALQLISVGSGLVFSLLVINKIFVVTVVQGNTFEIAGIVGMTILEILGLIAVIVINLIVHKEERSVFKTLISLGLYVAANVGLLMITII